MKPALIMFYYCFTHFCLMSILNFIFLDSVTLNLFYYDHSYALKRQNSAVDATFLCKKTGLFIKRKIERGGMSSGLTWEGSQHKDYCEDLHDEQEEGNLEYKRINWSKSAEHFTHLTLMKTFCLSQIWIVDMLVSLTEEFLKKYNCIFFNSLN